MQFSVLMSLYHKEKPEYLNDCFASLAKQTLLADEIVLVFDGEITEELRECVTRWMHCLPLKIVKLPENVGLGKALNTGLLECSHEIVARMDTDDVCCKERFENQINIFKRDVSVDILGGQILEFENSISNIISKRMVPINNNDIIEFAKKRNPINHMTVMYKKSKIIELGGYKHHLYMEDYNLWLRAIQAGLIIRNINKSIVYARAGDGLLSRRKGLKYIISEFKLFKLKRTIGLSSLINDIIVFMQRVIIRAVPRNILAKAYFYIRNEKSLGINQ